MSNILCTGVVPDDPSCTVDVKASSMTRVLLHRDLEVLLILGVEINMMRVAMSVGAMNTAMNALSDVLRHPEL
jgi:hypothetical protein